ncbi:MAG: hypothetical protein PHF86_08175, partial [Candidatus Nanoarchaeia archaeon]|nr:hypothetical protein [Candidatus Nanoarchaeia archaeon]
CNWDPHGTCVALGVFMCAESTKKNLEIKPNLYSEKQIIEALQDLKLSGLEDTLLTKLRK